MNKGLKIFLITLLSIITVTIIVFLVLVLTNKINLSDFRFNARISKEKVVDQEYDKVFDKIDIKSDAGDIYIKESDTDKVKVVVYGEKERTAVEDNETLSIKTTTKECHFFCTNTVISKIEVYIPSTYTNPINIDTSYGDIKADVVYDLNAETNYGDIKINKANNSFKLETNYGDIKIDEVNIAKDSSAETNFGDVKVESTNEVNIVADTDLGDTKVNNNYPNSEITLRLETNLGDVKVNN